MVPRRVALMDPERPARVSQSLPPIYGNSDGSFGARPIQLGCLEYLLRMFETSLLVSLYNVTYIIIAPNDQYHLWWSSKKQKKH